LIFYSIRKLKETELSLRQDIEEKEKLLTEKDLKIQNMETSLRNKLSQINEQNSVLQARAEKMEDFKNQLKNQKVQTEEKITALRV
jgi:hypothetical protein